LIASADQTWAQTYPSRPVRLIVSSAAGGTGDTIARAVSKVVGEEIGANIVVDNRPGASGMLAARLLVEAEPDGYTLLHTSSGLVTNASFRKKMPYDITKDILALANLAQSEGYVVMVNSSLRANSIKELIAVAKNRRLFYGSPGIGNAIHMPGDRILWAWLSRHWSRWLAVLTFVQPLTVIAWQRTRFREHWANQSRLGLTDVSSGS